MALDMLTFAGFIVAVAAYIAFLLWSFTPLVRPRRTLSRWLRVLLGAVLLCANIVPLFALPVALLLSIFSFDAGERFLAVALFPRTLPLYILNIRDRANTSATVIEMVFPLEIGGTRYAPMVRTACMPRRMLSIDKAIDVIAFDKFPTASGGEFVGQAGDATIALDASSQLCPEALAGRLKPGFYPDYRAGIGLGLRVYVVRGQGDKTQLYELQYYGDPVTADDIVLQRPQIIRIDTTPASEVMALGDLWPMRQKGEQSSSPPAIITAYHRLPAQENACVLFIFATLDFKTMTPKVDRHRKTDFRDIRVAERPVYCGHVLGRRIPMPAKIPVAHAS